MAATCAVRLPTRSPELVREALDGGGLPFVAEPVQPSPSATGLVARVLADIDEPISDLARAEMAATLADTLRSLTGRPGRHPVTIDVRAVELARDYLAAHASEPTRASTLEAVTGTDRFPLARQFRLAFGTSPDRYRMLRRLGLARTAIEHGLPLAQAAASAGFADQSHMTRQFKRAYGLTPARWTALQAAATTPP